jgi:hypothetical protein
MINENKSRFNFRSGGRRYSVRLTDWAAQRLTDMAGRQKSEFLADAITTFAAANGIATDDIDAIFAALAEQGLNQTDVVANAITYTWSRRQP